MGERQPISTAPMDGTRVRLFHALDQQESKLCPTLGHFDGKRWVLNQFFVVLHERRSYLVQMPTHWAPLEDPDHAD